MLASSFEICFCFASASRHRFPLRNLFGEFLHTKIEVRVSRVYLTMNNCSACDECDEISGCELDFAIAVLVQYFGSAGYSDI